MNFAPPIPDEPADPLDPAFWQSGVATSTARLADVMFSRLSAKLASVELVGKPHPDTPKSMAAATRNLPNLTLIFDWRNSITPEQAQASLT